MPETSPQPFSQLPKRLRTIFGDRPYTRFVFGERVDAPQLIPTLSGLTQDDELREMPIDQQAIVLPGFFPLVVVSWATPIPRALSSRQFKEAFGDIAVGDCDYLATFTSKRWSRKLHDHLIVELAIRSRVGKKRARTAIGTLEGQFCHTDVFAPVQAGERIVEFVMARAPVPGGGNEA